MQLMSFYIFLSAISILFVYIVNLRKYPKLKTNANKCDNINNDKKHAFVVQESIVLEAKIIFKSSLQIGISMIFEVCVATITTMFIGHLSNSSEIISATGLARSFAQGTVIVISFGFHSALWTLIPEALGSNRTDLIAIYSQRAFVVCSIIAFPLSIMLVYSKDILLFIGINSDGNIDWNIISNHSYAMIPCSYLTFILAILHRVTQNLNYNFHILVIQAITFFMSIPLSYLFIIVFNWSYTGSAHVYNLCQFTSIILIVILLIKKGHCVIFKPLPLNKICDKKGLYHYLKLAVPGCIQLLLMWNVEEFLMLLTGCINNNSTLASSSTAIMIEIRHTLTFWFHGVSDACNIRIGKYMGSNSIMYSKRTIKIQIFYQILLFVILYTIYILFKYKITCLFTNDEQVILLISDKLIYVALLYALSVAIYKSVDAIYRALGYQKISAAVICFTQYLMALPVQLYLLFNSKYDYYNNMEMGIYVIWNVSSIGYFVADAILIFILLYYVSWNKALEDSRLRIKINDKNSQQTNLKNESLITKNNDYIKISNV